MSHDQLALLQEIQAVEFTCLDLQLYLDTHPDDRRALADYNTQAQRLATLKAEYAERYGPLMHFGHEPAGYTWAWVHEPWPWEIAY
ncbi:MAG: spore coat protein CotJB [Bacillota bacterium]